MLDGPLTPENKGHAFWSLRLMSRLPASLVPPRGVLRCRVQDGRSPVQVHKVLPHRQRARVQVQDGRLQETQSGA